MSSAAVGTHHSSGAGPLSLMSCVRESSPLQDFDSDNEKNLVPHKKKFWNRIKWFKKKNKHADVDVSSQDEDDRQSNKETLRSRSTSELSIEETFKKRNSASMHPGLSVSHDSVFHSPHSGSEIDLDGGHSTSSLSTQQPQLDFRLQTELSERLRLRRGREDTSEDDEGLPRSPCNSPTTTATDTPDKTAHKDLPTKSHSTCSDGSLLSMGSLDIEDDSSPEQYSKNSSKLSLCDKRPKLESSKLFTRKANVLDAELDLISSTPLNHSAARHRAAVRPKKTHGAPRKKQRVPPITSALPITLEVNEDSSSRGVINKKVPPGSADGKLNRSQSSSSAGSKSHETLEEDAEKEDKDNKSFFDRFFPRRSGRKKKMKEEKKDAFTKNESITKNNFEKFNKLDETYLEKMDTSNQFYSKQVDTSYRRYESRPMPAPRSGGAAGRQRVAPVDLLGSPELRKKETDTIQKKHSPEHLSVSPLQLELENRFKKRLASPVTSPTTQSPPTSPKMKTKDEQTLSSSKSFITNLTDIRKSDEISKSKVKLPALSSLQQRVLSLNEDEVDNNEYKSLTELPSRTSRNVAKSLAKAHSFKNTKMGADESESPKSVSEKEERRRVIPKAASLDSVIDIKPVEKSEEVVLKQEVQRHIEEKKEIMDVKFEITITDNESLEDKIAEYLNEAKRITTIENDNITISGPSHTAVVNVKSVESIKSDSTNHEDLAEKQQISITQIKLRQDVPFSIPSSKSAPTIKQVSKTEMKTSTSLIYTGSNVSPVELQQFPPKIVFKFKEEKDGKARKSSVEEEEQCKNSEERGRNIEEKGRNIEEQGQNIEEQENIDMQSKSLVTVPVTPRYKKNEKSNSRKSSLISISSESPTREKSFTRSRSTSLDSLLSPARLSDVLDKSSQDSLDLIETSYKEKGSDGVVLRKKSASVKESRKDEEPELMKVFARRSLKLRDSDSDSLSQQLSVMIDEHCDKTGNNSDKENQGDIPVRERSKSLKEEYVTVEVEGKLNAVRRKSNEKAIGDDSIGREKEARFPKVENRKDLEVNSEHSTFIKEESKPLFVEDRDSEKRLIDKVKNTEKPLLAKDKDTEPFLLVKDKENPLLVKDKEKSKSVDNKEKPKSVDTDHDEFSEVTIRRPNNFTSQYQRAVVSMAPLKTAVDLNESAVKKQTSFHNRRKTTDDWITNGKIEDEEEREKKENIINTTPKSELIDGFQEESKNFNQRKAIWERRAQEAQKKSTP